MTTIVTKPLPHKVGNATISSGELKTVVMQFMENFLSLGVQLSTLQDAVRELQRRNSSARAEAAANMATFMASFAICNVDLGEDTYTQFLMSGIVPDTTKTYKVEVTFNNTSSTAYTCTVTNGTTTKQASITSRAGATPNATTEALEVAGTGYIKIDNQAATVDVVVKVYLA